MPAEEAVDATTPPVDRAIVLAGGVLSTTPDPAPSTTVVAADSGYDHAIDLAIRVDTLVGDMDSISQEGLDHARSRDVDILEYPASKDHTDLELAILAAAASGVREIDIHGGEGGSLGHLLGVALELTDERWNDLTLRWHTAGGIAQAARPGSAVSIEGTPGDVVSLIPVGDAEGVTTSGLAWTLDDEKLAAGTTRGLRNEIVAPPAVVRVSKGIVIVVWEGDQP